MKTYEGMFILPPEAAPEVRKNQIKILEDLIKKFNGNVLQKIEAGKKPLGYPLRKFREGYMVVVDFEMAGPSAPELQKSLPLQEDILKFMITVKPARVSPPQTAAGPPRSAAEKTPPPARPNPAVPKTTRPSTSAGPQTVSPPLVR